MRLAGLGLAVFALALGRSLADGFGLADESWFLQVVARMRAGEVLYRDLFFGSTPLSVYLTLAVSYAAGIEIVSVKAVTNACFAATVVLSVSLVRRIGLPATVQAAIAGAAFVWGRPYANPPYTPLAMTLLVATMVTVVATLDDRDGGRPRAWIPAGVLAGLSFASKQNIGFLAVLVVGAAWLLGRRRIGALAAAAAGFGVAVVAVLLPVAWSGGLPGLWDYGFQSKDAYLALGGVSYGSSMSTWLASWTGPWTMAGMAARIHGVVLVLPFAVAAVVTLSARRLDRRGWFLVACAALASLTAFPRWDRFHMAYAVPVHMMALGCAVTRWRTPAPAAAGHTVSVAIAGLALVVAAQPAIAGALRDRTPSTLPHFRGPLLPAGAESDLRTAAARLREAAGGEPVFILSPEAGFWHLASGVTNPTPFDIPAATSAGTSGVAWLRARLADGSITRVCVSRRRNRLALAEVAAFVEATFDRGPDVGPCVVYRARKER